MSKIFGEIPVERQVARHMQWWERRREEGQRPGTTALRPPPRKLGPYISISRETGGTARRSEVEDFLRRAFELKSRGERVALGAKN